jgi:hypothetical protein
MTYYEGQCGCPNGCFESFGQGKCSSSGSDAACVCSTGWGGSDCSQPTGDNLCSLHGHIIGAGSKESVFPFDYCSCDKGWTGIDCSSAELTIGNTPWGDIFADDETIDDSYTSEDEYQDDHPVWNISTLATIRVEMDDAVYIDLLQPWNLYNETYAACNVYFDNGNSQQTISNVGIRIKG